MTYDKSSLVRKLVPTSYHFDAYNQVNFPNSRDKPFFSDNVIKFDEEHYLTINLVNQNKICLTFSSVCPHGKITIQPYFITLEDFISKLQVAVQSGRDLIPFEISVKHNSYNTCRSCKNKNQDCTVLRKNNLENVYAGVSFNFDEMKEALAMYFEITNQTSSKGGKHLMNNRRNKFFGLNLEFGLSKDPNIASTLMGVAVKNKQNNNWYVFDPARNTRKNIANLKMGDFPVMLIPSPYMVGHLYKEYGQYYYVQSINPSGTVTLISATDGIIRDQLPEESLIPGMNLHTEVIAFDAHTMMNADSKENVGSKILAAMVMMNWSKGNSAEFSLDNINDDSFNGMGAYLPLLLMSNTGGLGNMFTNPDGSPNIMMMMALGSGESENNEMMQMMLLSQLLNNGGTSPLAGILPSSMVPATPTAPATGENVLVCENCNSTYPTGTNFCPKCGGKTKPLGSTCSKCGATLMEGAAFCHKCGTKVGHPVCSKCNREIDEGANFCPGCGTPLKDMGTPVATPEVVAAETKPVATEVPAVGEKPTA